MAHRQSELSVPHHEMSMMATGHEDDDLSMMDFFDAGDLMNDELNLELAEDKQQRRASIEFAREFWSSSGSGMAEENDPSLPSCDNGGDCHHSLESFTPSPSLDSSLGGDFNMSANSNNSTTDGFNRRQYNELLSKLAESMKRTEQSRAEIMRQRKSAPASMSSSSSVMTSPSSSSSGSALQRSSMPNPCSSPAPTSTRHHQTPTVAATPTQTVVYPPALSSFLSGSQSTLTSGLEQSRRALAQYMTQMSKHSMNSSM